MGTWRLLYRLKMKTLFRFSSDERGNQRMAGYVLVVIGLPLIFLLMIGSFFTLFRSLQGSVAGRHESFVLLASTFGGVGAFALFAGFGRSVQVLYLSRDLTPLLAMPFKSRTVFALKFWESALGGSLLVGVLGLPIPLAYGLATGASILFYPVLLLVLALLAVVANAIGMLLVMPFMRLVSPGRAREILYATGIILGVAVLLGVLFFGDHPGQKMLDFPLLTIPPGSWAAAAVTGAASLSATTLLGGLVPLAAATAALYFLCLFVAGHHYASGVSRAAEFAAGARRRRRRAIEGRSELPLLPRDVGAVVKKDLLSLRRDLRISASLLIPPAFGLFYALTNDFQKTGILGLAPYLLAATLSGASTGLWGNQIQNVGFEGRAYALILSSPIPAKRFLFGKWVSGALVGSLLAAVTELALWLLSGPGRPGFAAVGLIFGIASAVVFSCYATGVGALYPRFDWENPQQSLTGMGRVALGGGVFGLLVLGALCLAAGYLLSLTIPPPAAWCAAALLWVAVTCTVAYVVFRSGTRHLQEIEWRL
ncbi:MULTISPECIES: putative ABC exporter domain-containing protein [Rubrobacter]|uniref:putative ABC exporter domain-containing protein n=1 Tax=Rubrobacter TaxID=42255 RepID=UPI00236250A0|nr:MULTISPECIES: putative ABC exporter domain-containing protein [Rubrobacter]